LNILNDQTLPNDPEGKPMPFGLVADDAIGLSEHMLCPFGLSYSYIICTFDIQANN